MHRLSAKDQATVEELRRLNDEHVGDVVEAVLVKMRNEKEYLHDLRCFEEFALAVKECVKQLT